MDLTDILVALLGGTSIGILAKALAPGRDRIPLWLTVLSGVGGVVLASYAWTFVFESTNGRLDWPRLLWQSLVAVVLVVVVARLTGRPRP